MLHDILQRARGGAAARTWLLSTLDQRLTEGAWLYTCRQRACTEPSEQGMRLPRAEARLMAQVAMIACDPWQVRQLEACFFDSTHPGHGYVAVCAAALAQDATCLADRLGAVPWDDPAMGTAVARALGHAWTPWCNDHVLPMLQAHVPAHGVLVELAGSYRMQAARASLHTMLHTRSVAPERVLRALGRIGAPEDAARLALHLNHAHAAQREAAAWALAMSGDTRLCQRFIPGYDNAGISALPDLHGAAWARQALALRHDATHPADLLNLCVDAMIPAARRQQAADVLAVRYGIRTAAHTDMLFTQQVEQANICRTQMLASHREGIL